VFVIGPFGPVIPNVRYFETRINQSSGRGKFYVGLPHVEIANMAAAKTKLNIAQFLYTIATKFQRLLTGSRYEISYISASFQDNNYEIPTAIYPCFRGRVIWLDYSEECSMCRKERNQRRQQTEETSLITDRCLVQQEVLYGVYLKDVSMTQRIFSQMLLSLVHLLCSFCRPSYYQYFAMLFDFANGLPICRTVFALYVGLHV